MARRLAIATGATAPAAAPAKTSRHTDAPARAAGAPAISRESRATLALMLLPGALVVLTGFDAGGYFPATPAIAAIVLTQVLLVRLVQAERPFEGLAPVTLVAIAALGGYAALTLLSALWSHALGRALIEFDRAWLYLTALVLFGTVRASAANMRWLIRGLLAGASIVCLAGLISRLAPDVWHTAPDVANERLSYPVTYWNALGLLAALGIVLAAHTTSSLSERRAVRALAAGLLPLLAATLFFTFSRGAIAAGTIGLAAYALLGRPRALLSGVIAVVPASAVLIVIAYHANLLDTVDPTTSAAVAQGHRVALAAAVCCAVCVALRLFLAARLDDRLGGSAVRHLDSTSRRALLGGSAVVALALILALHVPGRVASDWRRFTSGAVPRGNYGDLRQRLTDPSNNGRTDLWKVAVNAFSSSPAHGYGAGMFQTAWDRGRPRYAYTVNAHSLYLQAMAEFGVPGIALLLLLVGAPLAGLAMRSRGLQRSLYAALLAASSVWALHAGVDWDWEMPVVTLPIFAIAGLALSPRPGGRGGWVPAHDARILLGLLCLATLALPVLIIGSERKLSEAKHALYVSDCPTAQSAALSSIQWLDARAQPYEILGFCDLERGLPHLGIEAMQQAVSRDPGSWETYYALAIAQASAGLDPTASARRALEMNPLEPLTREAVREFQTNSPTEWVRRAAVMRAAALASERLSIAPS